MKSNIANGFRELAERFRQARTPAETEEVAAMGAEHILAAWAAGYHDISAILAADLEIYGGAHPPELWRIVTSRRHPASYAAFAESLAVACGVQPMPVDFHSPSEPRPDEFFYGPIAGTMTQLDLALGGKGRNGLQIKAKNRRGTIWAVRNDRTGYSVWFLSQADFDAASRKLGTK